MVGVNVKLVLLEPFLKSIGCLIPSMSSNPEPKLCKQGILLTVHLCRVLHLGCDNHQILFSNNSRKRRLTLMFLRFCYFTGSFGEIFLVHVLAVVSDCKHPSFRHDISQISTVEAIGELDDG